MVSRVFNTFWKAKTKKKKPKQKPDGFFFFKMQFVLDQFNVFFGTSVFMVDFLTPLKVEIRVNYTF